MRFARAQTWYSPRCRSNLTAWAWIATVACVFTAAHGADKIDFSRDIRPILAEHCLQCHGPDKAEAGLRLHDRNSAVARGEGGQTAIVPGQPDASELLRRVVHENAEERMPPEKDPLKPAQVALLRRWIAEGAEYSQHWAFRRLATPPLPQVRDAKWIRNPIDQFVLERLEAQGIRPSPEADRYTLIKRLYYDLLGRLPDVDEVERFARDESSGAYDALVDRLLDSPHFGERWGRHWLDMARFADSDGYEKDRARPDAYIYRDWVIHAFNDDLPFDRFTIEQLAGDLLPNPTPSQLIATAFNRQTLTNEEGGVDQEEYRIAAVFDRTETLGAVWLGLTVGCARCHSHKYDPITQREYYELFAFFNDADEVSVSLPVQAKNMEAYEERVRPLQQSLEARKQELAPRQHQWEVEQRAKLEAVPNTPLANKPLDIERLESSTGIQFSKQDDGSYLTTLDKDAQPATTADSETYVIVGRPSVGDWTGLRIDALPDERLPSKGPGRSANGNFVVSGLRVTIVDAEGKEVRPVALQRVTADYEQTGYKAADVLSTADQRKQGWAVGGKIGTAHYLQVRTFEPMRLADGERLRIEIRQAYGQQHALGRFKVSMLVGDARGLDLPAAVVNALEMYPEKRIAATKQTLTDHFLKQDEEVQRIEQQIAQVNREFKVQFRSVRTLARSLRDRKSHRFNRGEFLQPQEEVLPGVLGRSYLPVSVELPSTDTKRTRLDLARWLVHDENPLTPRVAVNHVWERLFGAGLVRTPSDFGSRGEPPTHPELLDWLAVTYRSDLKWSTKRLIKLIVQSATYRQASVTRSDLVQVDPNNTLLARQNRLRVEGEIVRDLPLDAAGLLSPKVGGPSVFPPMPADLAKLSYANNFSWADSKGEDRYRRGMYTFFKRTIPHPTLMTFDCPDANVACVRRTVSNTPLQALTLLNNEVFVEAAQALARRVLETESADDAARFERAFRRCLTRAPSAAELRRFERLLATARQYYATNPDAAKPMVGSHTPQGVPLPEAAAWTATLRVLLNLDEFITRD